MIKPGKNLTRKSTPARVLVTIFGKPWGNHAKLPNQDVSENNPHEHPESDEPNAKRVKHHGDSISHQSLEPILNPQPADGTMTASGDQEPQSSQTPELGQHGPNLKCLNAEQRQQLNRMHVNLGHRTPQLLGNVLRDQGWSSEAIEGIKDTHCPTCFEHQRPKISRPSHLSEPKSFNDLVSIDAVKWTSEQGNQFTFHRMIDSGTNYHVAFVCDNMARPKK